MPNLGPVSLKHSVATGMSMKNICHCSIPVIFLPSGNEASFLREVTKKMLGHNKTKVKIRQARGIKVLVVCVYHPSILTGRVLLLCIIRLCKFQAKTNLYQAPRLAKFWPRNLTSLTPLLSLASVYVALSLKITINFTYCAHLKQDLNPNG